MIQHGESRFLRLRLSPNVADGGFGIRFDVFFAEDASFTKNVLGRITWLDNLTLGLAAGAGKIYLSRFEEESQLCCIFRVLKMRVERDCLEPV